MFDVKNAKKLSATPCAQCPDEKLARKVAREGWEEKL
jgi:hypothetical protein